MRSMNPGKKKNSKCKDQFFNGREINLSQPYQKPQSCGTWQNSDGSSVAHVSNQPDFLRFKHASSLGRLLLILHCQPRVPLEPECLKAEAEVQL